MKASQLLKLMLIAALPMRAVEDETAGAAPSSTEPVIETKQYTDGSSATGVAPLPDLSPAQQDAQAAAESPNVATLAASGSASGTSSSVLSASPAVGTAAAASSDQLAGEQGNASADGSTIAQSASASSSVLGQTLSGLSATASEATGGEQGNVASGVGTAPDVSGTPAEDGDVGNGSGSISASSGSASSTDGSTNEAASNAGESTQQQSDGADAGNVLAGGAPLADITSDSTDEPTDDHPAKPHLAALRRKIESGEAIIMADLLRLIHAIEETL